MSPPPSLSQTPSGCFPPGPPSLDLSHLGWRSGAEATSPAQVPARPLPSSFSPLKGTLPSKPRPSQPVLAPSPAPRGQTSPLAPPPKPASALLLGPAPQGSRVPLSPAPATSVRPCQAPTELLLAARRHPSFEAPPLPARPCPKPRPLDTAPPLAVPGSALPEARAVGPRAFCVVLGPPRALSPQSRLLG
uniref:Uncharacterized protein n=1 Tax=Rangifer tarandus platyrhynchus TaxID=3082113 RepID=A0ACB0E6Q1_RANTA|nr:unnamed protein product [Rangifer tarandus platyrhynchus]